MQISPLTLNDNLKQVSELIYLTDKYIYPSWFDNDIEKAKKILPYIIRRKTIYNYQNIRVCKINGEIAGIVNFISEFPKNNYSEMLLAYKDANEEITDSFLNVNKGYFEELSKPFFGTQLVCVATLPKYRRMGVAKKLLLSFDDKKQSLAAVKNNYNAIKLYESVGFKYDYDYKGYDGVECIEMRKELDL